MKISIRRKHILGLAVGIGLVLPMGAPCSALEIGDAAPVFADLPGVDGKNHSIGDFKDSKALVVIFSCNHCPYVHAYENRMVEIQRDYADKSVQIVTINSNDDTNYPADNFENMKKRAREKNFNFPYLRDASQEIARAYGAQRTPHVFLFDQDRILRYTGKIDDNWENPAGVKQRFLRDAIDSVLKGEGPKEPSTFAIGCTIKWKK
jgi:peroxiredoxin